LVPIGFMESQACSGERSSKLGILASPEATGDGNAPDFRNHSLVL
jgi:hypothetical protein